MSTRFPLHRMTRGQAERLAHGLFGRTRVFLHEDPRQARPRRRYVMWVVRGKLGARFESDVLGSGFRWGEALVDAVDRYSEQSGVDPASFLADVAGRIPRGR